MNNVQRFKLLDTVLFAAALFALLSISLTLGFLDWQSYQSSNRSLLLAIVFLIIAAVSRYVASEQNIHNLLAVVTICVGIVSNWIVYQNGSIAFVLLGCVSLIFIVLTMPKRLIWSISILFIASVWLNLNYLSIGVINSGIDPRILFSLITLIWPLHTLVTAEQIDEGLKTKAFKQILVVIAVLQLLFYFIFPSWEVNNLVNAAVSLAILVGLRNQSVLKPFVKYALVSLSIISYSLNLIYANGLTFYVVSLHLLFFYLLLPRFWANLLALSYVAFAVLMLSVDDAYVIRGVLNALFVAFLLNTLFSGQEARVSEEAKPRAFDLKVAGVSLLISLITLMLLAIPFLLSENLWWRDERSPIFLFSLIFVVSVLVTAIYLVTQHITNNHYHLNLNIQELSKSQRALIDKERETELALSAGNISIFEIDVKDKTASLFSGHHPILNIGDSIDIFDITSTAVDKHKVDSIVESNTSEHSHIVVPVHLPGSVGIHYIQFVTSSFYEKEGRTKLLMIRSDVTEQQQALKVIQESKEKQRELFAVVGHELRTPVAAIEMLINDDMADQEKLAAIKEITSNLLSVLEDMRTVVAPERAKQGSLVFGDPTAVIKRAVSPLAPLIKEKGLDLSLSLAELGGQQYHFAEQPLRQLVTNLTKNAAVHSEGSKIYVHSELKTLDGEDHLTLSVEDDGKGIPSHFVKSAFEPFSRGDTKADGTGLGLYIASELARELGGELNYTQSELGGACFTLIFALNKDNSNAQAQAQAQAQATLSGVKILLAEDEGMLRMLSEKLLTKEGASVTCFENGKKALDGFDDSSFDLVLTDLMMPELDGHGLVKAIRATGSQIPIIAVTAAVVGDETDAILADGADAFISKPINPEKLKKVLSEIGFERS